MSFSWLKNKKIISSFLLIFTISALGIFIVGIEQTKAGWWDALTNPGNAVFSFLSWIVYIIFRIFALLLKISGLLLDWAFGLEHFTDVPVVQEGWRISQGVVNLFFVLILMFIAFATILRLDEKSFGLKALLPKLIIAALLINFSLVIGGAIIDFTQVLSHYFLESFEGQDFTLSEYVANGLNITKIFETKEGAKEQEARGIDGLNILIGLIGGVAVIITMFIVMIAAAGFLIVRVVALWFLLVLAPIAWLFWILPGLSKQWSNWWSSFLKWAFFAPAFAFFFYLTLLTLGHVNEKGEIVGGFLSSIDSKVPLGENEGWASAFFASSELILQYIFLIILLIASLIVAQKAGVYGAGYAITTAKWVGKGAAGGVSRWQAGGAKFPSLATGFRKLKLEKLASATEALSKYTGIRALGRAKQKAAVWTSPGVWRRAWPERRKESEARAYARPTGSMRDQLNYILSLGKEKTRFGEQAEQVEVNRRMKEIGETSRGTDYLLDGLQSSVSAGDKINTSAYIRLLFQQNDQNEIMKETDFGKKYGGVVNDENTTNMVYDILSKAGFDNQQQAKIAMDLGNISFTSGNYMSFGMGTYNKDTGRFEKSDIADQRKAAVGKAKNVGSQQKAIGWHWNSIMEEVKKSPAHPDGVRGLHEGGKELLKSITGSDINQLNRARADFIQNVGKDKSLRQIRDFAKDAYIRGEIDDEQVKNISDFAIRLYKERTGQDIKNVVTGAVDNYDALDRL